MSIGDGGVRVGPQLRDFRGVLTGVPLRVERDDRVADPTI
jgi:hypothetical protein